MCRVDGFLIMDCTFRRVDKPAPGESDLCVGGETAGIIEVFEVIESDITSTLRVDVPQLTKCRIIEIERRGNLHAHVPGKDE